MEYSNGTADSYRYQTPYENCYPPAVAHDAFQVGQASVSRRFHPYGGSSDPHPDSGSVAAPFGSYPSAAHHCDQCGAVFDSVHQLSDHVQAHHYGVFPDNPFATQPVKSEGTNETAEILDLDSHKVHVYQPPGGGPAPSPAHPPVVSTPPYTPVGQTPPLGLSNPPVSMSWMAPNPQPVHAVAPPPVPHDPYRPSLGGNPYPGYDLLPPGHNGAVHMKPVAQPQSAWKPSNPPGSGPGGGGGGGGGPGGGSEVRRPKTYNCEACNKWFTSSGHLKRHYNTTLHKNAIKASNGTAGATEQGRRSATPSSKSLSSPPDSEEPSLERKPEETHVQQPVSTSSPDTTDTYRPPPQVLAQQLGNPYPQQLQQQQQQHYPVQGHGVQQVDLYRLPYQPPAPYYSQPGLPPRPLAAPMGGVNSFAGQYLPPQHGGYPPNSMMYPPNLVAPPPSSTVTVPGAGLTASLFIHSSSNNNNNNNVEDRKDDFDSVKLEGSDASSPSEGSVDNSDDLENDGSDSELRKKNLPPESPTSATGNFKCNQCHKEFNRVCYLTQHNNTFHKGDKPFKCHMCGKRFQNAELFSQHQQKHAGDKPYKCALCPKQFNHKTDLRRHMCLHTGQKPFMCQVCNKGFIRKDHMVKHVLTHTRRNSAHNNNNNSNAPMPSS